ncbi:unnamed protein product [Caenorhabditis bovis]|uniref:Galectin n=1 Tax=Caenorhabditis bovis TaxID=2654633 RepID=A0A8S1FEQ3_9PELO|nr:unnamed protein product [Caenorhabditis bovis]
MVLRAIKGRNICQNVHLATMLAFLLLLPLTVVGRDPDGAKRSGEVLIVQLEQSINGAEKTLDFSPVVDKFHEDFRIQACSVLIDFRYSMSFLAQMILDNREAGNLIDIRIKEGDFRGNELSLIVHVKGFVFDDDMIFDFVPVNGAYKLIYVTILTCEP